MTDDPLADLLVDSGELDRAAIAAALKGLVGVDSRTRDVVTQPGIQDLSSKNQVLAFLLGVKAGYLLEVLDKEGVGPSDIVSSLGLPGGTVRRLLRELIQERFVSQDSDGGYLIAHHQVAVAIGALSGSVERGPRRRASRAPAATKAKKTAKAPSRARSSSSGLSTRVAELVEAGFFDTPKTLKEIQAHLKMKRGSSAELPKLSPIVLRLLRKGVLDRDMNQETGVYEYQKV